MNFGMLRGIVSIGSMLLVIALCLAACGDDSGTSAKDESSSRTPFRDWYPVLAKKSPPAAE